MKGIRSSQAIVAMFVMMLATTALASTPYDVGFTWNRNIDWKPGTTSGSTAGNPYKDAGGNPVWSAEYFANVPGGSDLDTSDGVAPWYTLSSAGLLKWDSSWWGGSNGMWVYQDDVEPAIYNNGQTDVNTTNPQGADYKRLPLVRWVNPCSVPVRISITSGPDFSVGFAGTTNALDMAKSDTDVAIVLKDASQGGALSRLYSDTVSNPLPGPGAHFVSLEPVQLELTIEPGDEILVSHRSRYEYFQPAPGVSARWTYLNEDYTIAVVPEPATLSLLALGGLALLRRRRLRGCAGQGQSEGCTRTRGPAVRRIKSLQAIVTLFVMALVTTSAWAGYPQGFTWNRWADWKPGTTRGSSAGNPCKDSAGNPVWSYEYYKSVPDGSDLNSTHPWYKLASSGLMVWDDHTGSGVWGYQFDNAPFIFPGPAGLGHVPNNQSYHGDHFAIVPLVRWDNPSTIPIRVSLTPGSGFQGRIHWWPAGTTADLVIARTDASDSGSVHLLYSQTIVKTLAQGQNEYFALAALDIENLALDPGDDILFSVRARAATTGYTWYSVMLDDDVNIAVVPEPATLSLLALGGMALLRRRRPGRAEKRP